MAKNNSNNNSDNYPPFIISETVLCAWDNFVRKDSNNKDSDNKSGNNKSGKEK